MKKLFTIACISIAFILNVSGQILTEEFEYGSIQGSLTLVGSGWAAHSGAGTNPVQFIPSSLNFPNYVLSVGGAITLGTSGEDVNKALPSTITSGIVYASFLVRVGSTQTAGDYFFSFGATSGTGTISDIKGRLFARTTAGGFNFGVSKASGSVSSNYFPTVCAYNTTYLVVLKYSIITGANNDIVDLFLLDSSIPSSEPSVSFTAPDLSGTDIAVISSICPRQGSAASSAVVTIDGIRVGSSWASVISSTPVASSAKSITNFTIAGFAANISGTSITASVPFGTTLSGISPVGSISPLATVNPSFTATQDFTSLVSYTVTAEDFSSQIYTVSVTSLPAVSSAKAISAFSISGQVGPTSISGLNIFINLPFATDITNLTATGSISALATVNPSFASAKDYTGGFVYTVTAEDLTNAYYTVNVNVLPAVPTKLLSESFIYGDVSGNLVTLGNGWTAHSGSGTNSIQFIPTGLEFPNYGAIGGGAVSLVTTGEDVNKALSSSITSGSVYAGFIVNVGSAQITGDYFFSFGASSGVSIPDIKGRLFAKSATGGFNFGVSKASGTGNYAPVVYAFNTNYLVVVKYNIVGGATNDQVDLYVFDTALPNTEPGNATVSAIDISGTDIASITSFALRQGTASSAAVVTVDGIVVATDWNALLPPAGGYPDNFITSLSVPAQTGVIINSLGSIAGNNISVKVPYGSNITSLSLKGFISPLATVVPSFSTLRDFTSSQNYTVTSQSLSSNIYTVSIMPEPTPSTDNTIKSFSFAQQAGLFAPAAASISGLNIYVPFLDGSTVSNLSPTGTIYPISTVNPSFSAFRDFSIPVVYTVTSQALTTAEYTVTGIRIPGTFPYLVTALGAIRNTVSPTTGITTAVGIITFAGQVVGKNVHTAANGNPNPQDFQYSIVDATGAITIRTFGAGFPSSTTVGISEGDFVTVVGIFSGTPGSVGASGNTSYGQFNGAQQITPIAPIIKGGSAPRPIPNVTTILNEASESSLVELVLNISTATTGSGSWVDNASGSSGFNVNATVVGTTNAYTIRVIPQGELYGKTYSEVFGSTSNSTNITIIGINVQNDFDFPFTTGYQIVPHRLSDILYSGKFEVPSITGFSINGVFGVFDGNFIAVDLPRGANLASLTPSVTITSNSFTTPASGATVDFTSLFVYTVTSAANVSNLYAVSVTSLPAYSTEANILSFVYYPQPTNGLNTTITGSITGANVNVVLPAGVTVTGLIPTIVISNFASVNPSSGVAPLYTHDDADSTIWNTTYFVTPQNTEEGATPYSINIKVTPRTPTDITLFQGKKIGIQPNPASTFVSVSAFAGAEVEVYNTIGVKALASKLTESTSAIDVSGLPKGLYFVKIKGTSAVTRLVIE